MTDDKIKPVGIDVETSGWADRMCDQIEKAEPRVLIVNVPPRHAMSYFALSHWDTLRLPMPEKTRVRHLESAGSIDWEAIREDMRRKINMPPLHMPDILPSLRKALAESGIRRFPLKRGTWRQILWQKTKAWMDKRPFFSGDQNP